MNCSQNYNLFLVLDGRRPKFLVSSYLQKKSQGNDNFCARFSFILPYVLMVGRTFFSVTQKCIRYQAYRKRSHGGIHGIIMVNRKEKSFENNHTKMKELTLDVLAKVSNSLHPTRPSDGGGVFIFLLVLANRSCLG